MLVPSKVRRARADEEEDLMVLCRELHRENSMFEIDEDKVRFYVKKALTDRGGAIVGVIGDPGDLQAAIYMLISQFWYTEDWHLEEFFSYVRPKFRRTDNARSLVRFAKKCSDEIGIPLTIGIMSTIRTKAKVRLYEREFAEPIGAFFLYRPGGRKGKP